MIIVVFKRRKEKRLILLDDTLATNGLMVRWNVLVSGTPSKGIGKNRKEINQINFITLFNNH